MANSSICPWCSYALLSQIKQGRQELYCFHCHQEIPAGIAQISPPPDSNRVNRYSGFSSTNFSNSVIAVNFTPSRQSITSSATLTAPAIEKEPKLASTLKPSSNQSIEDILLSYVAHFISRGNVVVSPTNGKLTYKGRIYQNIGYAQDFKEFWSKLHRRSDFKQLYLEGDVYCFGQFFNDSFEMGECVRCNLQVPIPLGMHQYKGICHLCDKRPTTNLVNLLALGYPPENVSLLQKLFALRGFKANFIDHPLQISEDILRNDIDLVLIYTEVSEKVGNIWLKLLRHHCQLQDVPVIALSHQAGHGGRNRDNTLGLEEYLKKSLGAESLASSLHYFAHQPNEDYSGLCWLPY